MSEASRARQAVRDPQHKIRFEFFREQPEHARHKPGYSPHQVRGIVIQHRLVGEMTLHAYYAMPIVPRRPKHSLRCARCGVRERGHYDGVRFRRSKFACRRFQAPK